MLFDLSEVVHGFSSNDSIHKLERNVDPDPVDELGSVTVFFPALEGSNLEEKVGSAQSRGNHEV